MPSCPEKLELWPRSFWLCHRAPKSLCLPSTGHNLQEGDISVPSWTATRIRTLKGASPIVCVTAYDFSMARIVDEAGFHLVLVGDSLGMTVLGYETTLPVTMEEMLHHTSAVARGVGNALVVADMPFMSYHSSISTA
ncbi:MAG: hypothetical protein E4H02_09770, partial [Lentisphaerales bacterium]